MLSSGHPNSLILALLLALPLLFAGCASQESPPSLQPAAPIPPSPEITDLLNNSTGSTAPQVPPPSQEPPAQPQNACEISLASSNLSLGDEVFVTVSAQAGDSDEILLSCPQGTLSLGKGSMQKSVVCKFPHAGYYNLTASIKGVQCDSREVSIGTPEQISPPPPSCSIYGVNSYRIGGGYGSPGNYHYEASVNYTSHIGGETLEWDCDGNMGSIAIPGLAGKQVSGTAQIQCTFHGRPINPSIPVSLGNDSCGSIPTH